MDKNDTIIVVGVTEKDGYGNLWVTPKGDGDRVKIGVKREGLHHLFEQGKAVILHWETYMNKPYVADAKLVEGELPPQPTAHAEPAPLPTTPAVAPQEKGMFWKEIGRLICAGKLEEVFGEKDAPFIRRAYKLQAIASLEIKAKKED